MKEPGSSFLRALTVLERIAESEGAVAAVDLTRDLHLPKPTVHRMLAALQRAGLVQRDQVAKRVIVGLRLQALAMNVLLRTAQHGPRHQILARLAKDAGETASFTVYERGEMLVVDRVESAWALRVNLFPGSRVPMHCSASGKAMLAMMEGDARERLLQSLLPLHPYTPNTITDPKELAAMLAHIRGEGVSTDDEEFMVGLVAIAVPVVHPIAKKTIGAVSLNAPAARMTAERARRHLPILRRAALAVAESFACEPKVRTVFGSRRKR